MFKVENMKYRYPKNQEDTIKGIIFDIAKGEIF
jgi:fluoroquinolone transport system ATP-binding protein